MIRLSACRRIRVVRWSMRNRSSSSCGSLARRSIASSSVSWRCSSDWLRRARLRKMSLIPCRSLAWPTAASMAVCCTAANACLTWPISSELAGSSGASAATFTSSPAASRLTTDGSRSLARSSAESRRSRSSRTMLRPTRTDTRMDITTASRPRPPARIRPQVGGPGVGAGLAADLGGRLGAGLGQPGRHAADGLLPGGRGHGGRPVRGRVSRPAGSPGRSARTWPPG